MKSTPLCLGLVLLTSCFAFAACGDDDDGGGGTAGKSNAGGSSSHAGGAGGAAESDGAVKCEVIGELCHEADTGSGPAHECHEVGHVGNAAACEAEFASCIGTCVADEGAGGAGSEQDPVCAALGELCHPVDDVSGPLHDCHELGHEGRAAACAAGFADCATACLAARELLEAGTAGAGGMSAAGAPTGASAGAGLGGTGLGGAGGAGGAQ
jgi:hypothetical protein